MTENTTAEEFTAADPFLDEDGDILMEIETKSGGYPRQAGKLWTGNAWLTVAQARDLRAWLDKVIP